MTRLTETIFATCSALLLSAAALQAQQSWVQVEAQPTLADAEDRARAYAGAFPNVAGFRLGTSWYAVVVGPYADDAAAASELSAFRRQGLVPSDAYVTDGERFGRRFFPVGAAPITPVSEEALDDAVEQATGTETGSEPAAEPQAPEETVAEARASEGRLNGEERRLLQEALKWQGHYEGAIDGAIGPNTRRAMSSWQRAEGRPDTGVLTTAERTELVGAFREDLSRIGMAQIADDKAGIEIIMPAGLVEFEEVNPPFVHYGSTGDSGVRVLLISQSGDEGTLFGLYDIMQTLEIVPQDGPRERNRTSFTLEGANEELESYTYAALSGGAVKGFTLIWPPEEADAMNRIRQTMRESFTPVSGVILPDTAGEAGGMDQASDLLSGLEVRRPARSRTGFFVADDGAVLTTLDAVENCERISLGTSTDATITARDTALGLALLSPETRLAPIRTAALEAEVPRLGSEVAVAGFSYEDILDAPVMTFGTLSDVRGLGGEETLRRLDMETLPGDSGGPVLDQRGAVIGMLLPAGDDADRRLPADVSLAAGADALAAFLAENGLSARTAGNGPALPAEDLTARAADMTTLVSCWN
ncbi:trypsin-like peptidase domain-containing protein [Tropicimonas sp. IMCC34011]|uniref:trypsin-like peptidase domain-containing protein n=1 Tax=Tropicimonas sp. IMCC34011 TaxID=2248759 RepID=UPI001E371373|nr:trypsin-like peptidase domain-containing protein [Tropicimonas sp. IMCC34011]